MAKRYRITEVKGFSDNRVFQVEWDVSDWPYPERAHVWVSDHIARCTRCQGLLVAMRADCPHAKAVKRLLAA